MKKFTKKILLEHFHKSDKEDIIKEVITLFEKFDNVKEFYKAELSENNNPVLESYKKKIANAYAAPNPSERRTNLNVNKLIRQFKKVKIYRDELIDLLLYRVECGVKAIKRNEKRTETFYNCIIVSFKDAVDMIVSDNSVAIHAERIRLIIEVSETGKHNIKQKMENIFSNTP